MNQNDVIRYVQQQFGIQPNYQLARQWNACVFSSPVSGRWFALLIQSAEDTNLAYLEVHCGERYQQSPIFSPAKRMRKAGWLRVTINEQTPREEVNRALEQAFQASLKEDDSPAHSERLIYVPPFKQKTVYRDQPISLNNRSVPFAKPRQIPREILKMNSLYDYTLPPLTGRAKNFYVQGKSIADYQDDYDYQGDFQRYFPVYHDMTTAQLRGYFTWRTKVRNGKYPKAPTSFVYVYLYELINQIGISSPLTGYQKLIEFKKDYAEFMDKKMTEYLNQWLRDYVIYYQLGPDYVKQQFAERIKGDAAYNILSSPEDSSAEKVMAALCSLSSYQLDHCPLAKQDPELLAQIVKDVWQRLSSLKDEDVFKNYLGWQGELTQRPFANAVFYDQKIKDTFTCKVDEQCSYSYKNGKWRYQYYLPASRRKQKIGSLLHEIDRLVRQAFHCGRQLKPRPIREKILSEIKPAIIEAQRQIEEARRPKIKINLTNLEQIRADASVTRESLLTDEEREAEREEETINKPQEIPTSTEEPQGSTNDELGLSKDELYLLTSLLAGKEWRSYFKRHHLMVSIIVDEINDKLFDEIGDTVIEFDDQEQPQIVEDYREDIEELIN
ncbi:MAG: TerB N-terminal domain-containing protein [Limosilactobacillus sp.]|uniref:TerB N-terminal domain-containing protein n=1 Tax=Limosilactobacillus sp. TaxID=2773925 RepID=UPI0025BB928B|nr:TerB N-terminal domain-containing protein [Limosilactobacillus sp.]MCI1975246.1 TerB N-terminal domain-containing protein [Limosilactobacillus sp.]MCI2030699.1 TerB N-terminal domain-containing protein [Limosilactobacillus sp.]